MIGMKQFVCVVVLWIVLFVLSGTAAFAQSGDNVGRFGGEFQTAEFENIEPLEYLYETFYTSSRYVFPRLGYNGRSLPYNWNEVEYFGVKLNSLRSGYAPFWAVASKRNIYTQSTTKTEIGESTDMVPDLSSYQYRKGYASSRVSSQWDSYTLGAGYIFGDADTEGWTTAVDVAKKWGRSLSVDGIFSDSYNFSLCSEIELGKDGSAGRLSVAAVLNPTERSRSRATTAEAYSLAGDKEYNPLWGMQQGKERSSAVNQNFEPTIVVNHSIAPLENLEIQSAVAVRFGRNSYSSLSWQGVSNPMPDYYAYLPSYQESEAAAELVRESWAEDVNARQLNFEDMYSLNNKSERANYILEERVRKPLFVSAVSRVEYKDFSLAVNFAFESEHCFKELNSLLGGGYWLDIDSFLERDTDTKDMTQNNMQNPDRHIGEGDKFGYNYRMNSFRGGLDAGYRKQLGSVVLYSNAVLNLSSSQRIGYWEKENFMGGESLGASEVYGGVSGGLFGGVEWLCRGDLVLSGEFGVESFAPRADDVFFSAEYRNSFRESVSNSLRYFGDVSVRYSADNLRIYSGLYYYGEYGGVESLNLYDDVLDSYVHYFLSDISSSRFGVEFGGEVRLFSDLWLGLAFAASKNIYTNNPTGSAIRESDGATLVESEEVYYMGRHIGGSSESVGSLSLSYNPYGWKVGVSASYSGGVYEELSPLRYTSRIIEKVNSEDYSSMINQEHFRGGLLLNLDGGYSLRLDKYRSLWLYANIQGVLSDSGVVVEAYQSRRFYNKGIKVSAMPSLIAYAVPLTFSAGAKFTF